MSRSAPERLSQERERENPNIATTEERLDVKKHEAREKERVD